MGLPSIGPLELIIVLAIAVLVLGPGRLPGLGKAVGDTLREFRQATAAELDGDDASADPAGPVDGPSDTVASEPKPSTEIATTGTSASVRPPGE